METLETLPAQIGLFNYIVSFFTGRDPSTLRCRSGKKLAPWSIVIVDTDVDSLCDADMSTDIRSIPDYIYET